MKSFFALLLTVAACHSQCACKDWVIVEPGGWITNKNGWIFPVREPAKHKTQIHTTVAPTPNGGYASLQIKTTLTTNYASIGTFTDTTGRQFDVQSGTLATNTVAVIDCDGHYEVVLKSVAGPVVDERKIVKPTPNLWWPNGNWTWTNMTIVPGVGVQCITNRLSTNIFLDEIHATDCVVTNYIIGGSITNSLLGW